MPIPLTDPDGTLDGTLDPDGTLRGRRQLLRHRDGSLQQRDELRDVDGGVNGHRSTVADRAAGGGDHVVLGGDLRQLRCGTDGQFRCADRMGSGDGPGERGQRASSVNAAEHRVALLPAATELKMFQSFVAGGRDPVWG